MKKIIYVFILSLVLIGGIIFILKLSNKTELVKASKQLVVAINNNDITKVEDIVENYPQSVNTLPSMCPRWWQLFTEQPDVYYPLQEACSIGNYDIVKLLIENNANVNLVWKGIESSKTSLMYAVCSTSDRKADIINLLIENGADKSIKDKHDKTAYDYAVDESLAEIAKLVKPE